MKDAPARRSISWRLPTASDSSLLGCRRLSMAHGPREVPRQQRQRKKLGNRKDLASPKPCWCCLFAICLRVLFVPASERGLPLPPTVRPTPNNPLQIWRAARPLSRIGARPASSELKTQKDLDLPATQLRRGWRCVAGSLCIKTPSRRLPSARVLAHPCPPSRRPLGPRDSQKDLLTCQPRSCEEVGFSSNGRR